MCSAKNRFSRSEIGCNCFERVPFTILESWLGYLCASLIGAIPICSSLTHNYLQDHTQAMIAKANRRQQNRMQAVLPVRVRGTDAAGVSFEGLAHTLDLTPFGARLGAIRNELRALDTLIIFYRQRRMEFSVVWTRLLDGTGEYQVGLQALSHAKEAWLAGLFVTNGETAKRASATSGAI